MVRVDKPIETVEKPWGGEVIWAHGPTYIGKILRIDAGKRLSLQRHRDKHETLLLVEGRARVHVADADHEVEPGARFVFAPGEVHRLEALTDCVWLEVSSPELDDVERLADDYGRA